MRISDWSSDVCSSDLILREGFVVPPDTGPEAAQLYAAFIAHGAVGAVEAWLHLPAPRDERLLLASIEAMHPSWYAPMRAIHSPIRGEEHGGESCRERVCQYV